MGRARSFDNQDILERATRLFWRNGYNGTSIRDLMEVTGLAKASLYNAFGSKEELFHSALNYYIDKKQSQSLALLSGGENGRDALLTYFNNLFNVTAQNHLTLGCLLVNTAAEQGIHDEAMREIVDRGMQRTESHLVATLQRGIDDGSIAPSTNPENAALCLIAMILGIRVMARKGIEPERVKALIDTNLHLHAPEPHSPEPHKIAV